MQDAPLVIEASCFAGPICRVRSGSRFAWGEGEFRRRGQRDSPAGPDVASLLRSARQGSGRRGRRRRTGTRGMASNSSRESSFSTVCVSG